MTRALAERRQGDRVPSNDGRTQTRAESQAEREQREAVDAWLRRVPDTPGDWLRQKFWIEYQRRRMGDDR